MSSTIGRRLPWAGLAKDAIALAIRLPCSGTHAAKATRCEDSGIAAGYRIAHLSRRFFLGQNEQAD
jgi:hypothetical protein